MPYDDKTIEDPERDRWKDEKVDRRNAVGMVAQKRAPALRRPWRAMVSRSGGCAPGYGGPSPPLGDHPHRYLFTVFAVDIPQINSGTA
jgi:phosphatidylethanolamine-binding protein (PEBP) family uncharacterized protein